MEGLRPGTEPGENAAAVIQEEIDRDLNQSPGSGFRRWRGSEIFPRLRRTNVSGDCVWGLDREGTFLMDPSLLA